MSGRPPARRSSDSPPPTHLHPPPVEVKELAESLCCLRVRVADDLTAVAGAPAGAVLSGLLLPARHEVWVSEHEPWERRRFSIAHEVGHYLLHAGEVPDGVFCRAADLRPDPECPERLREREANRFAAELLMPERWSRARSTATVPTRSRWRRCFACRGWRWA